MGRARSRIAFAAAVLACAAGCEALVGIHDKELEAPESSIGDEVGAPPAAEAAPGDGFATDQSAADQSLGDRGDDGASADDRGDEASPDAGLEGDGGAEGGKARKGDGGTDGAAPDGGPADASGDARVGGDGAAADADASPVGDGGDGASVMDPDLPCAQQTGYLYCNDFESVSSPGQGWDYLYNGYPDGGGGIIQLDTTAYVSPTHSVQLVAPPPTGYDSLQLSKNVGALTTNVRVAFDVRMDVTSFATTPQVGIVQMYLTQSGRTLEINMTVNPGGSRTLFVYGVNDGGPALTMALPNAPTMTWERIAIDYNATMGVSVWINGQFQGAIATGAAAPGSTQVILGDAFINPGGSTTVTTEQDNIVISGQ